MDMLATMRRFIIRLWPSSLDDNWITIILSVKNQISSLNAADERFIVLKLLADNTSRYLNLWTGVFAQEIENKSDKAESVGWHLVTVLKSALHLGKCCCTNRTSHHSAVAIPSSGEFAEIIDDFIRYVHMMNRLIYNPQSPKLSIWKDLHRSIESDTDLLLTTLDVVSSQNNTARSSPYKILYDDLNIPEIRPLGAGSFGTVYAATWHGLEVAVKIFHYEGGQLQQEIDVPSKLQALDSSHILKVLGHSENESGHKVLVLERMQKNLNQLKNENRNSPFPLPRLTDMMLQIAKGMRHLHKNNVIHRDLKPENVLVRSRDDQNHLVKVADFGTCQAEFGTQNRNTLNIGTQRYMAPELLRNGVEEGYYARNVDVYSFGITCSEFLTETQVSKSLDNLIHRSHSKTASERPSFEEICQELWLVIEELLTNTPCEEIKDSICQLSNKEANQNDIGLQPRLEGIPIVDEKLQVQFTLTGFCGVVLVSWLRRYPDGKVCIVRDQTYEGSDEDRLMVSEYVITLDDVDTIIGVKFSYKNSSYYVDAPTCCRIP